MSSNPYNSDHNQNYGGSMPGSGSHQPTDSNRPNEGMGGSSTNNNEGQMRSNPENAYGMGSQNTANSYNNYMGPSQQNTQPNYGPSNMHSSQGSYGPDRGHLGSEGMGSQSHSMGNQMMGPGGMPQNQPPIGQRSYGSSYQPNFGGSQGMRPDLGPGMGGMNSGGMSQGYMPGGQTMSSMPPVGMSAAPGTFKTNQGEAEYVPGNTAQASSNLAGTTNNYEHLPVSPEVQREFEEKATRSKQYKQTDVFAAILLKNEEDSLKVIDY